MNVLSDHESTESLYSYLYHGVQLHKMYITVRERIIYTWKLLGLRYTQSTYKGKCQPLLPFECLSWSLGVDGVVAVGCEVSIVEDALFGKCSKFNNLSVGVWILSICPRKLRQGTGPSLVRRLESAG